jgi:hypothetical protein
MKKTLTWGSVVLGLLLIVVAIVYFITPSGNLPTMMPGFISGGTNIHYKHGIGALVLGLAFFAFAWFQSAPSFPKAAASETTDENQ